MTTTVKSNASGNGGEQQRSLRDDHQADYNEPASLLRWCTVQGHEAWRCPPGQCHRHSRARATWIGSSSLPLGEGTSLELCQSVGLVVLHLESRWHQSWQPAMIRPGTPGSESLLLLHPLHLMSAGLAGSSYWRRLWEQHIFCPALASKNILAAMEAAWPVAGCRTHHQYPRLEAHRCRICHSSLNSRGSHHCVECQSAITDIIFRDNQVLYCHGGVPVPGLIGCGQDAVTRPHVVVCHAPRAAADTIAWSLAVPRLKIQPRCICTQQLLVLRKH